MKKGTKEFSQTASHAYKSMTESEKEELRKKCGEQAHPVTVKDIKRDGHKIFKNVDKQVSLKCPFQLGDSSYFFSIFPHLNGAL